MADEHKYDVFISYSHKDEEWVVNTLLPVLEKAGLKVCIDFRDFKAGKPSIFNMQDSAKESRQIVLNLTRNWLGSEWSLFEALIGASKDPAGLQQKIIPLLSEAGIEKDIHDFISMRSWVDFTRKDREEIAWKMLFTALGKPDAPNPGTSAPTGTKTETPTDWHLAHPYPMPPNFTGRKPEREMLTNWLQIDAENRLFILCALGGFGKSALAWHWLTHDVKAKDWPKVVWWSFYEGDASFEHFIKETLEYLNVDIPPGQRQQVDALLIALRAQNILLIMDGFERALRAYSSMNAAYQGDEEHGEETTSQRDCVNLNAEIFLKNLCVLPNIKGKVLMTTRLTPRAVEQLGELLDGCHEEDLQAMQKEDAVAFFRAQGIRGARAEIEAACEPYGYHPLSLRILVGLIANDRESPGDIATAGKLDITADVIQNTHHVLEVAYNTLSSEQQKLLSHIACFRSAMKYKAINAISDRNIDDDLKTLEHRGILHWDKTANKYDLHPIVRRYAYERLTTPNQTTAHTRLRDYFASLDVPAQPQTLEELSPVIELYHHTVRSESLDEGMDMYYHRLQKPLYYQFGVYQIVIELLSTLFPDGEDQLPRLKQEDAQGWTLNELANAYSQSGQPRLAVPIFKNAILLAEKMDYKKNTATGLGNVAYMAQLPIGALWEAECNLRRQIEICEQSELDKTQQSGIHTELGRVLCYMGKWSEAEKQFNKAEKIKKDNMKARSIIWVYRALRFLQMIRSNERSAANYSHSAIKCATRALELVDEHARVDIPVELNYVEAHWMLGAVFHAKGESEMAEFHLGESLRRCRKINLVMDEADILLDLARLRYDQKIYEDAKNLAEEALLITERCGYVLQGADVHLFLAQFALEQEKDKKKARELAEKAKELATCDGPPYYYKVAYEEAERFLENLEE